MTNKLPFALACSLILVPGGHSFGATEKTGPAQEVYKTVGERKLTLDLDYPPDWKASDTRPAIVFFFGGGWTSGSPGQFKPQAEYFAKRGLVCVRADYRLRGRDGITPDKCVDDAFSAMRWVRSHASRFRIDPNRIVAAGGSAGGHLAGCTCFVEEARTPDNEKDVSPRPNPVLDLAAVRAEKHRRR